MSTLFRTKKSLGISSLTFRMKRDSTSVIGGIYRKHDNPGIYLFEIALGSAGVVGMRRTDARSIDKNDPALKEGRRVSKLDRRDLLLVSWITGFRNVVGQGSEIDLLPRSLWCKG